MSKFCKSWSNNFFTNVQSDTDRNNDSNPAVMFSIPFIGQSAADSARRKLQDVGSKIGVSS